MANLNQSYEFVSVEECKRS